MNTGQRINELENGPSSYRLKKFAFCILVNMNSDHFRVHLSVGMYMMNLPISIREWVISQWFPFFWIIVQNFSLQSIYRREVSAAGVSGYKWWVSIRSKRPDIIMRELWWWFRFEGSSIKTRKLFIRSINFYLNLRMTFLVSISWKAKHDSKWERVTSTIKIVER